MSVVCLMGKLQVTTVPIIGISAKHERRNREMQFFQVNQSQSLCRCDMHIWEVHNRQQYRGKHVRRANAQQRFVICLHHVYKVASQGALIKCY